MIPIGRLRHRVRIMRPERANTDARDANGAPIVSPQAVDTVWAEIRDMSSREALVSQQNQTQGSIMVTIRYRGDVGARWWFEYDDPGQTITRKLNIEGTTNPDGRREDLLCNCSERPQVG